MGEEGGSEVRRVGALQNTGRLLRHDEGGDTHDMVACACFCVHGVKIGCHVK